MAQYQKIVQKLTGEFTAVLRVDCSPQLFIPFDPDNTDYQEYLLWLSEGNEPIPADQPE
jgi:hypothetical protein